MVTFSSRRRSARDYGQFFSSLWHDGEAGHEVLSANKSTPSKWPGN